VSAPGAGPPAADALARLQGAYEATASIPADASDLPLDERLASVAAAPGAATTIKLPQPPRPGGTGGVFAETGSAVPEAVVSARSVPAGALRQTLDLGPPWDVCANGCFDAGSLAIIPYGNHGGGWPWHAGSRRPRQAPVRGPSGAASAAPAGSAGTALLGLVCALLMMAGRRWSRLPSLPEAWRPTPLLALPERPG